MSLEPRVRMGTQIQDTASMIYPGSPTPGPCSWETHITFSPQVSRKSAGKAPRRQNALWVLKWNCFPSARPVMETVRTLWILSRGDLGIFFFPLETCKSGEKSSVPSWTWKYQPGPVRTNLQAHLPAASSESHPACMFPRVPGGWDFVRTTVGSEEGLSTLAPGLFPGPSLLRIACF